MARIIPISKLDKTRPLTIPMIKTLRLACKKQLNHEPLGQIDLKGSFNSLLKRGFINATTIRFDDNKRVFWYVTKAGIRALSKYGFYES